jgi:ketosteroid isomerase-like protein
MSTDESKANKALVAEILRANGQGDLRPLFAALDEQVKWEAHAPPSYYRFGGSRSGRAGVVEAAAAIAAEYTVQRYDVKELVAEGETVWALSEASYIHNNKPLKYITATRWVLRNGKIVEFNGFFDTAQVLAQQGRLGATG